jgi:hypothetical protein
MRHFRVPYEVNIKTEQVQRSLAERWKARFHKPVWGVVLWIQFKADGALAEVMVCRETTNTPEWSEIHLAWAAPHHLRVAPEEFTTWLRRLLGADDMKLDHAPFDEAFWVESSNEDWAREILDDEIRSRLLDLQSLGRRRNRICADVNSAGVRVRVFRQWGENEAALTTLIETGLAMFRRARGPVPSKPLKLEELPAGRCPVCCSPVSPKFACPGCGTPHHADCWKYSGGCGIFACAGRARRPKSGPLRS